MMPTAISQILEQIINAVVSIGGAYVLLKAGRAVGKTRGDSSYGEAYGAGGTLGTVAGAAAALVLVSIYLSRLPESCKEKNEKRQKQAQGNL